MKWQDILLKLQSSIPPGKITTYKELSLWAYGHPNGTQAVVAMLKAAINDSKKNMTLTNRVVSESGTLSKVKGQDRQLAQEGIIIEDNKIDMRHAPIVRF